MSADPSKRLLVQGKHKLNLPLLSDLLTKPFKGSGRQKNNSWPPHGISAVLLIGKPVKSRNSGLVRAKGHPPKSSALSPRIGLCRRCSATGPGTSYFSCVIIDFPSRVDVKSREHCLLREVENVHNTKSLSSRLIYVLSPQLLLCARQLTHE